MARDDFSDAAATRHGEVRSAAATAPPDVADPSPAGDRAATRARLDEPDFDHMLTSHLLGFGRAMSKRFEALLAQSDTGLTSAQARVILKLYYGGPMTQKALADDTDVAPPTLARTLEVMERDALVSRVRNPEDRREILVELTGSGRDRLPGLFELFRAAEAWLTDGLSAGRVARLLDELSVVKNRLADYLPCCEDSPAGGRSS